MPCLKELQDVAKRLRQVNEKMEEIQQTNPSITKSNTQAPPQLNSTFSNPPQQTALRLKLTIGVKKVTQQATLQPHPPPSTITHPFSCDVCGKGFKYESKFTRHLRVHAGEKPFQCTICHSKFSQKQHMKVHMRTHTGERRFQCAICHKKSAQKQHMKRHMTSIHKKPHTFAVNYAELKLTLKYSIWAL